MQLLIVSPDFPDPEVVLTTVKFLTDQPNPYTLKFFIDCLLQSDYMLVLILLNASGTCSSGPVEYVHLAMTLFLCCANYYQFISLLYPVCFQNG